MAVTPGTQVTQAQMDDLAALANTKLVELGSPAAFDFDTAGNWLPELDRLRAAVGVAIDAAEHIYSWPYTFPYSWKKNDPQFCVSGPWCFFAAGGIDKNYGGSCLTNFKDVSFYFTSATEFVMKTREWCGAFGILNTLKLGFDDVSDGHYVFHIGGDTAGKLYLGDVSFAAFQVSGSTTEHPSFTYSTNIPGLSFTEVLPGFPTGSGTLVAHLSPAGVDVSPGEYYIDVSVGSTHIITESGSVAAIVGFGDPISHNVATAIAFDVTESNTAVSAPEAVRGAGAVSKVVVQEIGDGDLAPGIWIPLIRKYQTDGDGELVLDGGGFPIPIDPYTLSEPVRVSSCNVLSSPGVEGLFVALTKPVTNVNVTDYAYGNKHFPYGDRIMRLPAPNPVDAAINEVEPAIGFRPPRYPCFRDTDTIPTGGDWATWDPYAWQIYSVKARRKATLNAAGILIATAAPADINVKVGHMKSATFTEAISFLIPAGQPESATQYVCWPIFDGTPLAYQCDEELFICATAVRPRAIFNYTTSTSEPSHIPPQTIIAAYVSDLEAILNLL